jgi:hypothetical protein
VSGERVESFRGEDYVVRRVTGSAATKTYRCPGCRQPIRPATPHTVSWPVVASSFASDAAGLEERRHWHNGCWTARERRH